MLKIRFPIDGDVGAQCLFLLFDIEIKVRRGGPLCFDQKHLGFLESYTARMALYSM